MQLSLDADPLILAGAALLAGGALVTALVQRLRLPAMLAFLGLGMLLGSDGLEVIDIGFDRAGTAQTLAVIALVVILFEGGLTTSWRELRSVLVPATSLATLGVLTTAAVTGLAAYAVLDVPGTTAALLGAVVASTDAAAVFSVVRGQPLPRRVVRTLEAESGLNDPAAALLTVGVLATWSGDPTAADWVVFAVRQLVGGLVVGLAVGWATAAALRRIELAGAAVYPVIGLAGAGLAYGVAAAGGASGLLATFVAGVAVATLAPRRRRAVTLVTESLAASAQMVLFFLLGLLVFPSDLPALTWRALAITAALVLVARPVAVVLAAAWARFRPAELALVSWAGLRGAVPIVLATFALTEGHPDGVLVFDVVFFVVVASALVQGLSVRAVADRLGLLRRGARPPALATVLPVDELATDVIELELTDAAGVVGHPLRDVPLPGRSRVSVVARGQRSLVPDGDTVLRAGDVLAVASPTADGELMVDALVTWAGGTGDTLDAVDDLDDDDGNDAPICPSCGVTALPDERGGFVCEHPDCEGFGQPV